MKISKTERRAVKIAETREALKRAKPRSLRKIELELHLKRMLVEQLKSEMRLERRHAA